MKEYIARSTRRILLDLQLFAEGGEGGGGEGGEGGTGGEGGNGGAGKTFTQAELDAAVQSRLSRAEKAATKALAKELGYDSVEAMQAALKPKDKDKDKDKGPLDPAELSRLVDEQIKEREKEQNQKTFQRLLTAEVKVLANELGFADWEDARALSDLSSVKENDKGELDGVKEALEALAKKKPHLLKAKQGSGRVGADVGGAGGASSRQDRLERMKKLAQGEGTTTQAGNDPWKR